MHGRVRLDFISLAFPFHACRSLLRLLIDSMRQLMFDTPSVCAPPKPQTVSAFTQPFDPWSWRATRDLSQIWGAVTELFAKVKRRHLLNLWFGFLSDFDNVLMEAWKKERGRKVFNTTCLPNFRKWSLHDVLVPRWAHSPSPQSPLHCTLRP